MFTSEEEKCNFYKVVQIISLNVGSFILKNLVKQKIVTIEAVQKDIKQTADTLNTEVSINFQFKHVKNAASENKKE